MVITSSLPVYNRMHLPSCLKLPSNWERYSQLWYCTGKKFFDFKRLEFYFKLIVGVIPALLLGHLFSDKIDALLENPTVVAVTMLLGGVVLLFIDKVFKYHTVENDRQLSYGKAFTIGIWQTLAMIPGVSRSAASIIGGMQQKLTRSFAAEFSFFLAVPTMMAATGYKLLKAYKETPEILTNKQNLVALGVGNLVAFIVAISRHPFLHWFFTETWF